MLLLIFVEDEGQVLSMSEAYQRAMFDCDMSARVSTYEFEVFLPSVTVTQLLIAHIGRFVASGSFD